MSRVQPGWLVVLCAVVISVSGWLPWLTTTANGYGRASAIGGVNGIRILPLHFGAGQAIVLLASVLAVAGAMTARGLSKRVSAAATVGISLAIAGLTAWFFQANVHPPNVAGYGLYIGAAAALLAILCAVWSVVAAL